METQKSTKKPPFKKLTLDMILEMACWNPENFEEYQTYQQSIVDMPKETKVQDYPIFTGWRRYSITLHCVEMTIIARKHPANNGYQIRDYIARDH